MTVAVNFTIQKLRYGTNTPWFGLKNSDFIVPFPYFQTSDVYIALSTGNDLDDNSDRLIEGTHYTLRGSQLQLDEQSLGLDKSSPLEVFLSIRRVTNVDLVEYQKGHPIKSDDLNYNFEQLLYLIEENNSLIMNNTHVGDSPPLDPYRGQHFLDTRNYREFIYTGSQWVQPT